MATETTRSILAHTTAVLILAIPFTSAAYADMSSTTSLATQFHASAANAVAVSRDELKHELADSLQPLTSLAGESPIVADASDDNKVKTDSMDEVDASAEAG